MLLVSILVGLFGILLGVHELGDDLPFVTSRVVMIGVFGGLLLGPLLARVATVHGLVLVEVVVFVLIKVGFRHFSVFYVVSSRASNFT